MLVPVAMLVLQKRMELKGWVVSERRLSAADIVAYQIDTVTSYQLFYRRWMEAVQVSKRSNQNQDVCKMERFENAIRQLSIQGVGVDVDNMFRRAA